MSSWLRFVLVALFMWSSAHGVWQLVRSRAHRAARPSTSRGWLRSRGVGAAWLALGLFGLIATSNAVGWQTAGSAFWTDGGVPGLEASLRDEIVEDGA